MASINYRIPFSKFSGCGNDFILFDNRTCWFPDHDRNLIKKLCHRRSDGIVLLGNSTRADFSMRIFNADGSEAEMCGNGLRCLIAFADHLALFHGTCSVETKRGIHHGHLDPTNHHVTVTLPLPGTIQWNYLLTPMGPAHFLNTGVPHVVIFVDDVHAIDLDRSAPPVRHHKKFHPHGTNVNVAHINQDSSIQLRTFERGIERETLACGTGAVAAAITAAVLKNMTYPLMIRVQSGNIITISFKKELTHLTMSGPVVHIHSGTISF